MDKKAARRGMRVIYQHNTDAPKHPGTVVNENYQGKAALAESVLVQWDDAESHGRRMPQWIPVRFLTPEEDAT